MLLACLVVQNAIVQAKSGSGKTAAFVAPILSKIDTALPHPQVGPPPSLSGPCAALPSSQ